MQSIPRYSLSALVLYMLKLGAIGFGGPVALVGYMQRDLVESRGWISDADYKEGLTLSQLAPGPLAAQLAIYLGYVDYKILGATLVGVAFVLPSFLMVLGIGWAYVAYGGLPWMQSLFYGVGAAVIGIIAMSAKKLTEKSIGSDRLLWAIYLLLAGVTIATETESALLFLAAGVIVLWARSRPPSFGGSSAAVGIALPGALVGAASLPAAAVPAVVTATATATATAAAGTASAQTLGQLALFFTKAGAFVFGSGLAIVPFLYGGVVKEYGWLDEGQFVDAVAVAMITPGPVVITVGFIGYLVAGVTGAVVAALATFLPCYLLTIIPAPYMKKHGKRPAIVAFVDGVTAAAVGAIAGSVVVLARRSIVDGPTLAIAVVTALLLWRFKNLKEPVVIAGAALFGLLIHPLVAGS